MTKQPKWKLLANLGDASPIDYGGYFIYQDETGVYAPEGELLESPDDDAGTWTVYRFSLDQLQQIEDEDTHTVYLVSARYTPDWPHAVSQYDEWFHKDLVRVAESQGDTLADLRAAFCSPDVRERAWAYRAVGEYHGLENLDSYPLRIADRADVERRYAPEVQS